MKTISTFSISFFFIYLLTLVLPIYTQELAEDPLIPNAEKVNSPSSDLPLDTSQFDVGNLKFLDSISVEDTPKDDGKSLSIQWKVPEDPILAKSVFKITRKAGSEDFTDIAQITLKRGEYLDDTTSRGASYTYRFLLKVGDIELFSKDIGPVESKDNWYEWDVYHWNSLFLVLFFTSVVIFFIAKARKDPDSLFIRRISSLDAIEEAVGRSTEMGRKMFYIPGISDISDPQTIASLSILGHVAKVTAEYGAELEVPNKDPLTMATAREIVKEAYLKAGRPDAFREDMVNYVTYDQFAYTAGVNGKMVRERPAANFFIGWFAAESLILAETGQSTGAIQVAGTAQIDQLPFFVAACDYTMIGEELYAAGAYLSKDPMTLGSIKAQDLVKKYIILIFGVISVILVSIGLDWPYYLFSI
ncbi:hypothetical protein KKB18_05845, partial [bacterium]|nr:hypothetical protein [bacterium]